MLLSDWEEYLTGHFNDLLKTAGERRLLCLEHGLEINDVELLKQSIQDSLKAEQGIQKHPIAWAVYASEIGYLFSGGEFWHTFENHTPGWEILNARATLKSCFLHFRDTYQGAVPSGPWAEHRSIISWPITHAILPLDLQKQLAKVLSQISYSVSDTKNCSPEDFGQLIARHSWDTTSRFRQFVEQPALVGQIALSLLQTDSEIDETLILASTVKRIRQDLNKVSQAKFWLKRAQQQIYHRRTKLKGIQSGDSPSTRHAKNNRASNESGDINRLLIRPSFRLIPSSLDNWRLEMNIPDYSSLLSWFPECHEPLTQSRIFVEGSSGKPIAPKALLHGGRSIFIKNWPEPLVPLLKFEKSNSALDTLLEAECTIDDGPQIFKITSDNTAKQILSRTVRPNSKYLILISEANEIEIPEMSLKQVDCSGIRLFELSTEGSFNDTLINSLEKIGIQTGREIEIKPVGLPPVNWDGEGSIEWLSTDEPAIAIHSNYPIKQYQFILKNSNQTLTALVLNEPNQEQHYIQLPALSEGIYSLHISATPVKGEKIEQGILNIRIRNPIVSDESSLTRGAMQINSYPPAASLEELWEGSATLEIIGPKSRDIKCHFKLIEQGKHDISYESTKKIRLPLSSSGWQNLLKNNWQNNKNCLFAYGAAGECELSFYGNELGNRSLTFERETQLLRWAFGETSDGYQIRLINEKDSGADCLIKYFSFDRPDVSQMLSSQIVAKNYEVTQSGLYVAISDTEHSAIIIPPEITQFDDFILSPKISRKTLTVQNLLSIAEYWSMARLIQPLSSGRFRNRVLEVLTREIFYKLGGRKWFVAERSRIKQEGDNWITGMSKAIPSYKYGGHWAKVILENRHSLSKKSTPKRVLFLSELTGESFKLCEFALRLASDTASVRKFAGKDFENLLNELTIKTTISRVARFLCLIIRDHLDSDGAPGESLYPSWQWN